TAQTTTDIGLEQGIVCSSLYGGNNRFAVFRQWQHMHGGIAEGDEANQVVLTLADEVGNQTARRCGFGFADPATDAGAGKRIIHAGAAVQHQRYLRAYTGFLDMLFRRLW